MLQIKLRWRGQKMLSSGEAAPWFIGLLIVAWVAPACTSSRMRVLHSSLRALSPSVASAR
jgi:hypothetical protein